MNNLKFNSILIIGMGLIGSSLARAIKKNNLANNIYGLDTDINTLKKCEELEIISKAENLLDRFSIQFDLIIICSPLSTYKIIFNELDSYINQDTLITDVGSTKKSVIEDFESNVKNKNLIFIPSHPIAGLEKSGPEFGFAELFSNRFCIITPFKKDSVNLEIISSFWNCIGMQIEIMDADHHDRVLAMTSHIPQLIAYSIVSTATDLETHLKEEVIKYSAAGFRDFTRLAGSDPIMWRDIYAMNKDAVLEMLGRFVEDLTALQKAIRNNDQHLLEKTFHSTRKIRKIIEEIGQAGNFDPTESKKIK